MWPTCLQTCEMLKASNIYVFFLNLGIYSSNNYHSCLAIWVGVGVYPNALNTVRIHGMLCPVMMNFLSINNWPRLTIFALSHGFSSSKFQFVKREIGKYKNFTK